MSFTSFAFFFFFPVVVAVAYAIPVRQHRWGWLLLASYLFYMSWQPLYGLLLATNTLVTYGTALAIAAEKGRGKRRLWLLLCIGVNLGTLFFFKYANFFSVSSSELFHALGSGMTLPLLKIGLPVALSFYTFQSVGYVLDVYNSKCEAEKHLGIFALFIAFFPQLVAGPIGRGPQLLPQLHDMPPLREKNLVDGATRMLWGFFKKLVIADNLAQLIAPVYDAPHSFSGLPLVLATILFSFQIYCDFSGYTDIAIGAAQVLGITLIENFRFPYAAVSIGDFWRRWHISLSSWFRDYVYIPLGGSRVGLLRQAVNLMVVFLLSGLWHGANWTFVVWGALYGVYLVFGLLTKRWRDDMTRRTGLSAKPELLRIVRIVITFGLVTVAWIFFRANSISDALYIVTHLFAPRMGSLPAITRFEMSGSWFPWGMAVLTVIALWLWQMQEKNGLAELKKYSMTLRWGVYYAMILAMLFLSGMPQQFLYFQF